jgi:FkbM family methyltransferase
MIAMGKLLEGCRPLVERLPVLALTYRTLRDCQYFLREPRATPMGFKFAGHPEMEKGLFEAEELELVREHLKDRECFINIGANVGYYCCVALHLGKRVIAFEPIELNVKRLYKNILANGWTDIEVFPVGLSNKVGLSEMYGGGVTASLIRGWGGSANSSYRIIPLSTLDTVLSGRLKGKKCFFLIDVEGAEKLVLEGSCLQLKLSPKPIWMVEISVSEHQPRNLKINPHLLSTFQMFWDNGYEARTANREGRLITRQEIEKIAKSETNTLDTHNFIFS